MTWSLLYRISIGKDVSNISTLRLLFCLLVEALKRIVPLSLIKIIIFKCTVNCRLKDIILPLLSAYFYLINV